MQMKRVKGYPQPLGIYQLGETSYNFAVSVPKGKTCELLLYHVGDEVVAHQFEMSQEDGIGEVRFLALEGFDAKSYEYNYKIDGKVCLDPYVREITGHSTFGTKWNFEEHKVRGKFQVRDYDWEGDKRPELSFSEVIAYALHVRGFTKHASSKVKNKGTFRGIIEKIPYLKELGINQIQCMPIYEFEECIEHYQNYWGYGKGFYFAPKATYAASKDVQIEFKDMVKACHKSGIEVILEMPFHQGILPQVVLECLKYYFLEYHVDGFLLNPYHSPWDSILQDPLLKAAKLFKRDEWYQNTMRRFLKGDEGMIPEIMKQMCRQSALEGCCNYITTFTGFTLQDLVSYDGKHNEANGEQNQDGPDYNYSWNCGAEGPSRKKSVVTLRKNQVRNAFLLLLTSQSTPCILAGDEFGNSQNGNNNCYCQDNEISWLNWNNKRKYSDLFSFVKELISFRKQQAVFHQEEHLLGMDRKGRGIPDISFHGENAWQIPNSVASRQLGVLYADVQGGSQNWFVAYNMHWEKHTFALPALKKGYQWYLVGGTKGILENPIPLEEQKNIEIEERTIAILQGRQEESGE